MSKNLKIMLSRINLTLSSAPADVDTYPPPTDFQPLEEEQLSDILVKGEVAPQPMYTSPLWSMAGIDGEGDRPFNHRIQAYFSEKPPPEPMWLVAIEMLQSSAPPSSSHQLFARASEPSQISLTPTKQLTASASVQKTLKVRTDRRVRRLLREMITDLPPTTSRRTSSNDAREPEGASWSKAANVSKIARGPKAICESRSASGSRRACRSKMASELKPANGSRKDSGSKAASGSNPTGGSKRASVSRPTSGSKRANASRPTSESKIANASRPASAPKRANAWRPTSESTGACPWPSLHGSQTSICTHQTLTTNTMSGAAAPGLRLDSATSSAVVDDYRSTTDIAVQAQALDANTASKSTCCIECRRRGNVSRSEEWIGGARALRDSHVRLVVRQLRHIELLNRAIDGVASADDDPSNTSCPAEAPTS